jgi:hypothetical protein
MSKRSFPVRVAIGVLLAFGTVVQAEDLGSRRISWEPRVPVGKCLSPAGSLLVNERPDQPWQTIGDKEDILTRDLLLALPGMRASVETQPKAVELTLGGNWPKWTEFSGLESAVILHDSRSFDLDFTLQRGRAIVTNRKEKGSALVWLRVEGAAFQLRLAQPGDAICLGLYGFWPRGVPFTTTPKPEDGPARTLTFFVVKGQVDVKTGGTQHALSAPPGSAYFHWDNVRGADERSRNPSRLPKWADPDAKTPPEAKAVLDVIEKYQAQAKDKEPRTVLYDLLAGAEKERDKQRATAMVEFAVLSLAAMNDIDRVMQALGDPKQAEARKSAVIALRHWIGNATGHDRRLYQFLLDPLHYSRAQASTLLQLLHSAFPIEEPDTYETLIAYLRHENLAIRELAWWHLSRLVPENLLIPYDPAASEAERAKAYKAWKTLIPSGSLPTKRKPKK